MAGDLTAVGLRSHVQLVVTLFDARRSGQLFDVLDAAPVVFAHTRLQFRRQLNGGTRFGQRLSHDVRPAFLRCSKLTRSTYHLPEGGRFDLRSRLGGVDSPGVLSRLAR